MTPSKKCHDGLSVDMESRKSRKAGLPKRDPPWSAGGHCLMVSSIEESRDRICLTVRGASSIVLEDIFLSVAASESENTKERMRL